MQSIILLHGALGCDSDLTGLSESLAEYGFITHHFSFSGHGNVPFQKAFGIEQFANELHDFIELNKIDKPNLFGYSMGGYVALYYALLNRWPIDTIITLGTKFNWSNDVITKETGQLNPQIIEEKLPSFAKLLKAKHGTNWVDLLSKTADLMKEINQKQFLSVEKLTEIKHRVVLGLGDKDTMVSLDETLAVRKMLPNSYMYVLPDTKHPFETVDVNLLAFLIKQQLIKSK